MLKQQCFQASVAASAAAQASWNASYYSMQQLATWGLPAPPSSNVWQQEHREQKRSGHHEKCEPNVIDGDGKRLLGLPVAKTLTVMPSHGVNVSGNDLSPSGKTSEAGTPLALAATPAPVFLKQAEALASPLVVEEGKSLGAARVSWTVDAKRLRGNDKIIVSPPFDLPGRGAHAAFKMMIRPKIVSDTKGGASFKKARGRGGVELKCEETLQNVGGASIVSFELSVGGRRSAAPEGCADQANVCLGGGPVSHDFSESPLCKIEELWDFVLKTDQGSQTFNVCLDVLG